MNLFLPEEYRPENKIFNAVTMLQVLGIDDPTLLPTEELRHADTLFRELGNGKISGVQFADYLRSLLQKYQKLREEMKGKDAQVLIETLLRQVVNKPTTPLNYMRRDLQSVNKVVFKTKDQIHREQMREHGVLTKRGHGRSNELPILAYISPRRPDRLQYLSKDQRLQCLENRLANAEGCPDPPAYNNPELLKRYPFLLSYQSFGNPELELFEYLSGRKLPKQRKEGPFFQSRNPSPQSPSELSSENPLRPSAGHEPVTSPKSSEVASETLVPPSSEPASKLESSEVTQVSIPPSPSQSPLSLPTGTPLHSEEIPTLPESSVMRKRKRGPFSSSEQGVSQEIPPTPVQVQEAAAEPSLSVPESSLSNRKQKFASSVQGAAQAAQEKLWQSVFRRAGELARARKKINLKE